MFPRVRGGRHLKDYELEVKSSDGTVAALDFRRRVVGRGGGWCSGLGSLALAVA